MTRMRPLLVFVHRWFGLIGAIWLFLIGATGALLVFHEELDAALNPEFHRAESRGTNEAAGSENPMLDRVATAALAGHPGSYVRYMDLPDRPGGVVRAFLSERVDTSRAAPRRVEVALDPATARVQAERVRGSVELSRAHLIRFLYVFHYSLHLGSSASWALGLLALVWMLDHALVLVLSFKRGRRWKESFKIRRGARGHRLWFDLHRAMGLWLMPVTLTLAASGLYFNWFTSVQGIIDAVAPLSEHYDQRASALEAAVHHPPMGFARAIALASSVDGAEGVDGISYDPRKGLYWASVFDPRDLGDRGGRWVFIDALAGQVVADGHRAHGTVGDQISAWQLPLHSGRAFGWPGRIAVLLAGLGLCGIVITGLLIWAKKRRARWQPGRVARHDDRSVPVPDERPGVAAVVPKRAYYELRKEPSS